MKPRPIATIVMAVRNGERYVAQAINSVLTQTREDFELHVIDDASTDRTPEILERARDPRIIVTRQASHIGAGEARNLALTLARGKYVAILDSDDAARPRRLERQIQFLERRPDIAILGSSVIVIDERGIPRGLSGSPGGGLAVRWRALMGPPFWHSTMAFRASLVEDSDLTYDQRFAPSEDYDLCVRLLAAAEGYNIPEPLAFYRVHPDQLTATQRQRQLRLHDEIARRTLRMYLPDFDGNGPAITELWKLVSGIPVPPDRRIPLGHLYLDLFASFRKAYAGHPELSGLARSVASIVYFRCLMSQPRDGWRTLARRLFELDRMSPGLAALYAATRASRHARWCWSPRIRRAAARTGGKA